MKNSLIVLVFLVFNLTSFGQNFLVTFYSQKAYYYLYEEEKKLLLECSEIIGVPLDSMTPGSKVSDEEFLSLKSCSILSVQRMNFYVPCIEDPEYKTNTIINDICGTKSMKGKTYYLFIISSNKEGTSVTIQKFY